MEVLASGTPLPVKPERTFLLQTLPWSSGTVVLCADGLSELTMQRDWLPSVAVVLTQSLQ